LEKKGSGQGKMRPMPSKIRIDLTKGMANKLRRIVAFLMGNRARAPTTISQVTTPTTRLGNKLYRRN
jgi:hypothetical protein